MGLVVLVVCAPVLIPLILIALFLGLFGDKLFPPKYHTTYICNQDGEILDMYEDHTRPIRQQPQAEIEYDDFDDDDDFDYDDDWDDDDDCDTIIYVDDDEFDSCNSYHEEPEPQVTSDEPMLYGGLPFGDGQIFFEDDGDAYL